MEAALDRFRSAGTQVLGVSVDSLHSHANWGASMGGVSFPLLADFHPKGELAQKLGLYLDGAGISDRATVIIDKEGIVRYADSAGPGGKREVDDLVAAAEKVGGAAGGPSAPGVPAGSVLYVKSNCGPSLRAKNARNNLGLDGVKVVNVTEDKAGHSALVALGKDQAPCLVMDGKATFEADDICVALANHAAPLWS